MNPSAIGEIGYFGKVPTHADFVRFNVSAPSFRAIDDWVQSGMRFLVNARIECFEEAYGRAGTTCFLYYPPNGSAPVVGAIRPSHDSVGRKYPFFVAAPCDAPTVAGDHASSVPYTFDSVFGAATGLVNDAVESRCSAQEVTESLRLMEPISVSVDHGVRQSVDALRDLSFGPFCEQLWGDFEDPRKEAVFRNLIRVLEPMRAGDPGRFSLGFQFPLATGELLLPCISFWIESCRRVLARRDLKPALLWQLDSVGPTGPSLYVNFSKLPTSGFVQLLQISLDQDDLCQMDQDLLATGRPDGAASESVGNTVLASRHVSLWEVLEAL